VTEPGADSAPATAAPTQGPTGARGSATDVAKDEAAGVADTAGQAANEVAGTAKQQAGEVVHEARDQARSLMDRTRTEVTDQASTQQQRAAGSLRSLSDELRSMATSQPQQGMASELANQAADRAGQLATWLQGREPGDVLHEVTTFARRRPGTFLVLAAGAGVVAGRLTRGMTAGPTSGNGSAAGAGTSSGRHAATTRPFTTNGDTTTTLSPGLGETETAARTTRAGGNDVTP
jgi:hypothetical protein